MEALLKNKTEQIFITLPYAPGGGLMTDVTVLRSALQPFACIVYL